jgi:hypothetical protein
MQKPPELHLWISGNRPIHTLKVDQVMTGADTAETWVTLVGRLSERRLKWAEVQSVLELSVDWSSVARLKSYYDEQVCKWLRFEQENAADLKELERLKKKLGINA